jgi:hypothetical protein
MFDGLTQGRIWIHVSNRKLNSQEQDSIRQKFQVFCSSWAAHGKQLTADFQIVFDQILVLAVDENMEAASGCSIDSATAIFKEVDAKLNLDLFNRLNLCFVSDNQLSVIHKKDLQKSFDQGSITAQTTFLDNSIASLDVLRTKWEIPFESSWAFKTIKKNVEVG